MHFSGTKGKNTLPTSLENLPLRLEGACDWRRREITAIPPIRPTGSLRIALGERCFREPTLQAALVRLTFQCMVGSRLPRQSAASIAEMPCRSWH